MDPADPGTPGAQQGAEPHEGQDDAGASTLDGAAGRPPEGRQPGRQQDAPPVVPASRRGRRKKILAWTSAGLAAVLLVGAVGVILVYRHLDSNLRQVDVSRAVGRQPVDLHPKAENILVIGSDTRAGQSRRYGNSAKLTTDQSDTLLLVHIPASRAWADVMSIPRDSWVNIPGCRMGNGRMSSPTEYKINEAFAIGDLYGNKTDLGTACTIKTVEKNTGIRIGHFLNVNFAGFKDMVNAVDGVPECNTRTINDPKSGLHLTAGHHILNGSQALGYVRARYSIGNGSDLQRITRQQVFMSALVDRVKSKLLNPLAVYQFLDAATKSITVDRQLGGIHGLYDLAMSVKRLPPSKVTFFTLPTYPRYYVVPSDTADVLWTQPQDSLIFQAFRNDVPVSKSLLKHPRAPWLSPGSVAVRVLNGTGVQGLQTTAASSLQQKGFKVAYTGDASSQSVNQTVIRYHPGQQQAALLLASKVHGAALRQVPGTGKLALVLGSDYGTTVHTGPGTKPQPASSFAPRTATQNICTNA